MSDMLRNSVKGGIRCNVKVKMDNERIVYYDRNARECGRNRNT